MTSSFQVPVRQYAKGMGDAVADRTINRKKEDGTRETWADVALRVAIGNSSLVNRCQDVEFEAMHRHLRQASLLMSGRHLQHGDASQGTRPQEVFTNCLEGSTKILTIEYGSVEIEKVAGQRVTVIAGDGVPRPAIVHAHGQQPVNDIVFRPNDAGGGKWRKHIAATANHRWKLRDGFVSEELKVGDVLAHIEGDVSRDPVAVVHGLVFGDGSAHKGRRDSGRPGVSQGRTYASIRVCKQDSVAAEIHRILDQAGYKYTQPTHANGDRVYYIGKFAHAKELPYTNDPEYIAGFIYGWWLADGSKGVEHALEISTCDAQAADWLEEHAAFAGMTTTMHRVLERKEGDGSFVNGKPLHCLRLREGVEWKVESIAVASRVVDVYCPEEPVTSTFVLAGGMLTGNCSTAASSFLLFYLLLNGSGVGRSYDDDMMLVDWAADMPKVIVSIDADHPDVASGRVKREYADNQAVTGVTGIKTYMVPDSREGWAKAVEQIERLTYEKRRDLALVLDFSNVRPHGSPIGGMQNRPASGPGPLMDAIANIAKVKGNGMAPWLATMHIDHYLAECVLVGGARRAARIATKTWRDKSVLDFISVKKGGVLWSSNNSITVDKEFWELVKSPVAPRGKLTSARAIHAKEVFEDAVSAGYNDGTGEPGFINVDRLEQNDQGMEALLDGDYAESARFKVDERTKPLHAALAKVFAGKGHKMIVNPCGEIALSMLGGYCVIADVVPYHSKPAEDDGEELSELAKAWDDEAEDAFRTATRALIRVNLMNSLYHKEVARTNRIGVGFTGIHEYAYARFGFGFRDLLDEQKAQPFWQMMARFSNAVVDEAKSYAQKLGVAVPHTMTTVKPAGTTSKLFGLTEGAHLPSMAYYLRWVQFRNDDPLVEVYRSKGYPVRELVQYSGTTIVGFPSVPEICRLGMPEGMLVTAAEATPEEQYQWLKLLEKYWLHGHVDTIRGGELTWDEHRYGNQISYTLKYDPKKVSFKEFRKTILKHQGDVKACSVMPQVDTTAYEYQPEEPVSLERLQEIVANITDPDVQQDIGIEHMLCAGGACPIDFREEKVA